MSITIKNAHWLFREKYNRLEENRYLELTPAQVDEYFNDAQIKYVNSILANSVESTTKISKDLAHLLVKSPSTNQPVVIPTIVSGTTYEMKSSQLAFECIYPVTFSVIASKTECANKTIPVFIKEHDDAAFEWQSTKKSSWKWNRCRAYIGRSNTAIASTQYSNFSVFLESDGDFTIVSVAPTYYKYPRKVCLGGYLNIDTGATLSASEFEMPDEAVRKIIDIAVELAAIAVKEDKIDQKVYQTKLNY